ncbi:MAG TPA: hypothetical protein VLK25_06075 [Allosphingosinicella sp.]|nr:hypothetical protein [Allosphingosinicella sp.]
MEHNHTPFAPEAATDEPASPPHSGADVRGDAIAFDPVPLRYRDDGLTPAKQREYVEALADTGLVNVAAARIGVSPQAVNRVRRRADARSFDLACTAAQRFGARHLQAIAFERAIQGTIRRHHYHGELVSEEVVYDNRLLIYLLGKTAHLLDEPEEARDVCAQWEPWLDALEQGLPPPPLSPPEPAEAEDAEPEPEPPIQDEVWEAEGNLWTNVPPPFDFNGQKFGHEDSDTYMRRLTDAEEAVWAERRGDEAFAELLWRIGENRVWCLTEGSFFPMEAETSKLPAERGTQRSSAPVAQRRERAADGPAKPDPIDVAAQWCRDGPGEASEDRLEQPEDHEQSDHDDGEHDESDQT